MRASDVATRAVSTTVPSHRPVPYPPSRRYEEIRVTYPAARARQLTALEAYKVRARYPDPRPMSDFPSDRPTPTKKSRGRAFHRIAV